MVGGTVDEVLTLKDRLWVNVRDNTYPKETCAIYLENTPQTREVKAGDKLWWQGRYAMWTSQSGESSDIQLNRIGFSGVERPEIEKLNQ